MRRRQFLGTMAGAAALGVPTARATQAGYGPLGEVEVAGAAEAVMGDDGRTAYLAATSGFATVDVSDPASPTVLAERRDLLEDRADGPMAGIIDIKVDGDRLVVPGRGTRPAARSPPASSSTTSRTRRRPSSWRSTRRRRRSTTPTSRATGST
ncbi:MAG: hypothetical protein U5J98_06145 [Halobacteriales archaeon]|nr:hypothetical protein [Halobacteriales archaeon]